MAQASVQPMTSKVEVSTSTTTTPKGLRVTIVGGGLGGALAARVLRTHHTVTILERTAQAVEFGAALLLGPSNMLFLDKVGLNRKNIGCCGIDLVSMWTKAEILFHEHALNWKEEYGDSWTSNSRAELQKEFLRLATAPSAELGINGEPAKVVFEAEVVSVDPDMGIVTLKDGTTYESDLVIGADGINSIVRSFVIDQQTISPPKASGSSAFRFSIPTEDAVRLYPKFFDTQRPFLGLMAAVDGSHRSMAIYPYRDFSLYNFVVLVPDSSLKTPATRNEPRTADEVLEHFQDFPEGIKGLIRTAPDIRLWQIRHQDPLPTYVRGRTVLLGDAAHAMVPQQAQGANQAIEDAEGLTLLNTGSVGREDVHDILKQWERVRRPRASIVQNLSAGILSSNDTATVYKHGPFYWEYPGIQEALRRLDAGEEITYEG